MPLDAIIEQVNKLGNTPISLKSELRFELKNLNYGKVNLKVNLFGHPVKTTKYMIYNIQDAN